MLLGGIITLLVGDGAFMTASVVGNHHVRVRARVRVRVSVSALFEVLVYRVSILV